MLHALCHALGIPKRCCRDAALGPADILIWASILLQPHPLQIRPKESPPSASLPVIRPIWRSLSPLKSKEGKRNTSWLLFVPQGCSRVKEHPQHGKEAALPPLPQEGKCHEQFCSVHSFVTKPQTVSLCNSKELN